MTQVRTLLKDILESAPQADADVKLLYAHAYVKELRRIVEEAIAEKGLDISFPTEPTTLREWLQWGRVAAEMPAEWGQGARFLAATRAFKHLKESLMAAGRSDEWRHRGMAERLGEVEDALWGEGEDRGVGFEKLLQAAQALYKNERSSARQYAVRQIEKAFSEKLTRQNPVYGLRRATPFREWLLEVWRSCDAAHAHLALTGWAVYNHVNLASAITPLPFQAPPARGSGRKHAKDSGGWLEFLIRIVLYDVETQHESFAVALAMQLEQQERQLNASELAERLYKDAQNFVSLYERIAVLSMHSITTLLSYSD